MSRKIGDRGMEVGDRYVLPKNLPEFPQVLVRIILIDREPGGITEPADFGVDVTRNMKIVEPLEVIV